MNAKIVKAEGILSGGVAVEGDKIVAVAEDRYLPEGREVIMDWPEGEPKRRVVGEPIGKYLARKPGHALYALE